MDINLMFTRLQKKKKKEKRKKEELWGATIEIDRPSLIYLTLI